MSATGADTVLQGLGGVLSILAIGADSSKW